MDSIALILMGVIIGFLVGMWKARKWWQAYNGGYGSTCPHCGNYVERQNLGRR